MQLIHQPVALPNSVLPVVALRVDRLRLAKRLWRGAADDGAEFGFELEKPLQPGETIFETAGKRYVVEQIGEPVLEIGLGLSSSAAAGIGWAVGNLHLELSADAERMLTPDEPAARALLARLAIPFRETNAVFRPGRFARGSAGKTSGQDPEMDELGKSHRH